MRDESINVRIYHLEHGTDSRAEQKRKVIALLECRRRNEVGVASGWWKMYVNYAAVVVDGAIGFAQACPMNVLCIIHLKLTLFRKENERTGWTKRMESRLDKFARIHCSSVGGNSVTKLMAPSTHASACPKHSLAKAT